MNKFATMQCQNRGKALHHPNSSVPQVLRGSRPRQVYSKLKQLGKPSLVQTFVAAPQEVRPSEGETVQAPPQNQDVHNPALLTNERAASKKQPFTWTKQWYPVAVVADTDTSRPHAVRMLGGKYVLWCDSKGEWHCQQDRCPHRLAPLSEGKIEADTLQCSYHGWRFRGDGTCAAIPQAPPALHDTMTASPRSCVTSFPVSIKHGLIWVWPDNSPDRFVVAAGHELAPEAPPEQGKDGLTWYTFLPWFARLFPYSMDTLFDNTLDPSHVPWSHHSVIGDRTKVTPIQMEILEPVSPKGLKTSYFTLNREATATGLSDKPDPATVHLQFRAPNTLVYDTYRHDGTRTKLLAYVTPTKPGECMVIAQTWDTRPTLLDKLPLPIPPWYAHQIFLKAADGDMVLLKEQEVTVPELPKGWREFHMPTRADVGVRMWREWLERYTNGTSSGPYQLASAAEQQQAPLEARKMTKEQLLDRFNQHVKHCPHCSGALNTFKASTWVAGVAAAVFAQLSLLSALKLAGPAAAAAAATAGSAAANAATAATLSLGPLSLPLHVVWAAVFAVASAACIKLALASNNTARAFVFEDYVHAHI
mmetsp:Transcript_27499/g.70868  ORF Transcript_27499/g.70868 Transcript_27499/m.70868 type:complete len:589 (-) Transcript_27499:1498-3264(-)